MTFALFFFYHNFWSTKNFLVRFISLEIVHPGLQFEHKFYLIWTKIQWVMTVWSRAIKAIKIRVSGGTCIRINITHETSRVRMHKPVYTGPVPEPYNFSFYGSNPPSLGWAPAKKEALGPAPRPFGTSKTLKIILKTLF